MKRALDHGVFPHHKYQDGLTPRVTNMLSKHETAKIHQEIDNRISHQNLSIELEQHERAFKQRVIETDIQQRREEINDSLAAALDTARFLWAEKRVEGYYQARQKAYRQHVKDFLKSEAKNAKETRKSRFFSADHAQTKRTAIDLQNQETQNRLVQFRAIAFKNKVVRTLREKNLYPAHNVVTMPLLTPTMSTAKIISWEKKIGDKINIGDILCHIKTDQGLDVVEANEEGYLARILTQAANNADDTASVARIGKPLAITVPAPQDVPRFAQLDLPGSEPKRLSKTPPELIDMNKSKQSSGHPDQNLGDQSPSANSGKISKLVTHLKQLSSNHLDPTSSDHMSGSNRQSQQPIPQPSQDLLSFTTHLINTKRRMKTTDRQSTTASNRRRSQQFPKFRQIPRIDQLDYNQLLDRARFAFTTTLAPSVALLQTLIPSGLEHPATSSLISLFPRMQSSSNLFHRALVDDDRPDQSYNQIPLLDDYQSQEIIRS